MRLAINMDKVNKIIIHALHAQQIVVNVLYLVLIAHHVLLIHISKDQLAFKYVMKLISKI